SPHWGDCLVSASAVDDPESSPVRSPVRSHGVRARAGSFLLRGVLASDESKLKLAGGFVSKQLVTGGQHGFHRQAFLRLEIDQTAGLQQRTLGQRFDARL